MLANPPPKSDVTPSSPWRCPRCRRFDSIPMPMFNLLDKLARGLRLAPFKCRACRAKFYRPLPPREDAPAPEVYAQPVVAAAPVRIPAVRRKDRADTLRRLETLIRNAQALRPGKR